MYIDTVSRHERDEEVRNKWNDIVAKLYTYGLSEEGFREMNEDVDIFVKCSSDMCSESQQNGDTRPIQLKMEEDLPKRLLGVYKTRLKLVPTLPKLIARLAHLSKGSIIKSEVDYSHMMIDIVIDDCMTNGIDVPNSQIISLVTVGDQSTVQAVVESGIFSQIKSNLNRTPPDLLAAILRMIGNISCIEIFAQHIINSGLLEEIFNFTCMIFGGASDLDPKLKAIHAAVINLFKMMASRYEKVTRILAKNVYGMVQDATNIEEANPFFARIFVSELLCLEKVVPVSLSGIIENKEDSSNISLSFKDQTSKELNITNLFLSLFRLNKVVNLPSSITLKQLATLYLERENVVFTRTFSEELLSENLTLESIQNSSNSLPNIIDLTVRFPMKSNVVKLNSQAVYKQNENLRFSLPVLENIFANYDFGLLIDEVMKFLNMNMNWGAINKSGGSFDQLVRLLQEYMQQCPECIYYVFSREVVTVLVCFLYKDTQILEQEYLRNEFTIHLMSGFTRFLRECPNKEVIPRLIHSDLLRMTLDCLSKSSSVSKRKFEKPFGEEEEMMVKKRKLMLDFNKYRVLKNSGVGYMGNSNSNWSSDEMVSKVDVRISVISSYLRFFAVLFASSGEFFNDISLPIVLESSILPIIENSLRSCSLNQILQEKELYECISVVCESFVKSKTLTTVLARLDPNYKPEQSTSIAELLNEFVAHANGYLEISKISNIESSNQNHQMISKLIERYTHLDQLVQRAIEDYYSDSAKEKKDVWEEEFLSLPLDKRYKKLLGSHRFGYMTITKHSYKSNLNESSKERTSKIAQEMLDVSKSLPDEITNAIYVRTDKKRIDLMKAIICGAAGTPYAHGCFEYDIHFGEGYPAGPPHVLITTTGGGKIRFNPNLYNTGKVCLSILGTWRGSKNEGWNPKVSTLSQVLISIQGIVMSELVFFNEPGYERMINTPEGDAYNTAYSNIVRLNNIKYAMIEQIREPSPGFENVIRAHFVMKKEIILETVESWMKSAGTEANYGGLVSGHNQVGNYHGKGYESQLREQISILKLVLDNLEMPPIDSLLSSKAGSAKISTSKQEKDSSDIVEYDINQVDIEYEDEGEMGDSHTKEKKTMMEEEDAVKDRWSRYIGVMGMDSVKKQAAASVFISGLSSLGVEVAKNLVLTGVKKITIHDENTTSYLDLSGQFFLSECDIGYNRAERSLKKLQQLNMYVDVELSKQNGLPLPLDEESLLNLSLHLYDTIILIDGTEDTYNSISKFCRDHGLKSMFANVDGVFARCWTDVGPSHECLDKNGEEVVEGMVKHIESSEEGLVTMVEGVNHQLEDGDLVEFKEVQGMELAQTGAEEAKKNINGMRFKVKVAKAGSFWIGDTRQFSEYIRGGIVKAVKVPVMFKHISYHEIDHRKYPLDQGFANYDFAKLENATAIRIAFLAKDKFYQRHIKLPDIHSVENGKEMVEIAREISKDLDLGVNTDLLERIVVRYSRTCRTSFGPLAAFVGGIVCQEAIKGITGKFKPMEQSAFFDCMEVLEDHFYNDAIEMVRFDLKGDREDGLRAILGEGVLEKIKFAKVFMVGSGAIGCELLKNYAMISAGTGKKEDGSEKGQITLTDPDIIEPSNLTRQFLFREKHLRKPKSIVAAAAAQSMNPLLKGNISARLDRVSEQTDTIYTDHFLSSQTVVTNALDNIKARKYIDMRCVRTRTPLIESGTLGPKGHVQVIIPEKTENYGSSKDPESEFDIPVCTLKMFPEETLHCLEWARDLFGSLFYQNIQSVKKVLLAEDEQDQEQLDGKIVKDAEEACLTCPKDFQSCITFARVLFSRYFYNDILQLIHVYPLDTKDKDGVPFWKPPKRPPNPIEFDQENHLHQDFVSYVAAVRAQNFCIELPYSLKTREMRAELARQAAMVKVPRFVPSEEKAREIAKEVESASKTTPNKAPIESEMDEKPQMIEEESNQERIRKVREAIKDSGVEAAQIVPQDFEKDTDLNNHVNVIHAFTCLRAANYSLDPMDWMTVKIKAGRIVPALATTTACIAALQTVELVKIIKGNQVADQKNSFMNLAVPSLTMSEPGEPRVTKINEKMTVSVWSRWEVPCAREKTLRDIVKMFEFEYGVRVKNIFHGTQSLYLDKINEETELDTMFKDIFEMENGQFEYLALTCSNISCDPEKDEKLETKKEDIILEVKILF